MPVRLLKSLVNEYLICDSGLQTCIDRSPNPEGYFYGLRLPVSRIIVNRKLKIRNKDTGVAQLVEHWSPKPGVGSSSLSSRAEMF